MTGAVFRMVTLPNGTNLRILRRDIIDAALGRKQTMDSNKFHELADAVRVAAARRDAARMAIQKAQDEHTAASEAARTALQAFDTYVKEQSRITSSDFM